MAKSKRVKPNIVLPQVSNLADADSTLGRIAALQRALQLIATGMNEEVSTIIARAEAQAAPLRQQIADLETALARYAEGNKDVLFTDKQRSREMSYGIIGYQASSQLDTIGKTSWANVLELIKEQGLDEKYVRQKPEVNKEALRNADEKTLKAVRCRVRDKDEFYYKTNSIDLGETAA